MWQKLKSFFIQSKRVWHLLRKPSGHEFKSVAKVSALGILVIGAIGFIMGDLMTFIENTLDKFLNK